MSLLIYYMQSSSGVSLLYNMGKPQLFAVMTTVATQTSDMAKLMSGKTNSSCLSWGNTTLSAWYNVSQ